MKVKRRSTSEVLDAELVRDVDGVCCIRTVETLATTGTVVVLNRPPANDIAFSCALLGERAAAEEAGFFRTKPRSLLGIVGRLIRKITRRRLPAA